MQGHRAALAGGLVAAAALSAPPLAGAAGFYVQEQSVDGLGLAFAGMAARAADAGTLWFNPAGMAFLDGRQAEANAYLVMPRAEIANRGSTAATFGTGFAALPYSGLDEDNPYDPTPVGNHYAATPLMANRLWLGLGVTGPFGFANEYEPGFFGRYDSTETRLLTLDAQPSIAYRLTHWLAVGGGLDIQYANADLVSALPDPFAPGGPTPATDGLFDVGGDDWSLGFNVGALAAFGRTRLGLHYRYGIDHTLEGDVTLTLPASLRALGVPATTVGGRADLNLPDIASVAVAHDFDRWTLLGQVSWFNWSAFDEIRVEFDDGRADAVVAQDYEDTVIVVVGAEWRPVEGWTVRAGFQYDPTPTQDGFRGTRVPDGDRYWAAVGIGYAVTPAISLDLAYAHIFVADSTIDVTRRFFEEPGDPVPTTTVAVRGDIEGGGDILGARLRLRF